MEQWNRRTTPNEILCIIPLLKSRNDDAHPKISIQMASQSYVDRRDSDGALNYVEGLSKTALFKTNQ